MDNIYGIGSVNTEMETKIMQNGSEKSNFRPITITIPYLLFMILKRGVVFKISDRD